MPDISFGEVVVIGVLALLVFGPDRLPKVAADAGRTLRQLRAMVGAARQDIAEAAGLDSDGELGATLRDLNPRSLLRGDVAAPRSVEAPRSGGGGVPAAAAAAGRPAAEASGGSAPSPGAASTAASSAGRPAPAASSPALDDWT